MAFVTLEQYKTYAQITSAENDRKLDALIANCEQIIKSYCGIDFTVGNFTEELDLEGQYLFLSQIPANSITTVKYYDADGTLQTVANTEYRLYSGEGMLEVTPDLVALVGDSKFISKQVQVVYAAGYATIPLDVRQATMDLVKYYDKSEYAPLMSSNVRTIDYDVMQSVSLPPHIRRVLAFYRKVE
jgi:hypothetical protein